MIGLWLSLVLSYAGLSASLGGPFAGALPFAALIASLTVILASLVRLIFGCSEVRALIGGVGTLCVLVLASVFIGAERADLNAGVGEFVMWHDGSPTGAGLIGVASTIATIVVTTLVAVAISRLSAHLLRRIRG